MRRLDGHQTGHSKASYSPQSSNLLLATLQPLAPRSRGGGLSPDLLDRPGQVLLAVTHLPAVPALSHSSSPAL